MQLGAKSRFGILMAAAMLSGGLDSPAVRPHMRNPRNPQRHGSQEKIAAAEVKRARRALRNLRHHTGTGNGL